MVLAKMDVHVCQRLNLGPYFSLYTKINLSWIKDLYLRHKAVKLLKEIILQDIDVGATS